MTTDGREIVESYFAAWKGKDFETLRSLLADDATFGGPLGGADDGVACLEGLRKMAEIIDDIVIRKIFVDGPDVLTWYDLHTKSAPPIPTANWSHIEGGKIDRILVAFDARSLAPGGK